MSVTNAADRFAFVRDHELRDLIADLDRAIDLIGRMNGREARRARGQPREVARVFFHRKHRCVLRKIMWDIWQMPMRPDYKDEYRLRADGTVDITSAGSRRC